MTENIRLLKKLHEKMNGETLPLAAYFQTCPDYMLMLNGTNHTIRNFNGTVHRSLGYKPLELYGSNIFDVLTMDREGNTLPDAAENHKRFWATLRKEDGTTIRLDFQSAYIEDGDYMIITGRLPLT